jgi:hypothetical protein
MEDAMDNRLRRSLVGTASAAFLVFAMGPFDEAQAISSCNATCSSNCSLTADIACDGADGIVLSSGADLDLAGHGITCSLNCPQAAVRIAGSGSVVKNTTGLGYITGAFTWAINCQGYSNSEVTGIQFNMFNGALNECAKIHNNLIEGARGDNSVGITSSGIANTDYIRDNWIGEFEIGIQISTSHDIEIAHNQIGVEEVTNGGPNSEVGIRLTRSGTADVELTYNFFHGGATSAAFMSTTGTVTKYGNSCDPANATCQTCSDCRQAGIPF